MRFYNRISITRTALADYSQFQVRCLRPMSISDALYKSRHKLMWPQFLIRKTDYNRPVLSTVDPPSEVRNSVVS